MAVFSKPAIQQRIRIVIGIGESRFHLMGIKTLEKGWLRFYYSDIQTTNFALPSTKKGQEVVVKGITIEEEFTKPPARYNSASLLRKMQREEIGTKTTRAGIIQTLHSRKYIKKERIEVTDLGYEVVNVLKNYYPSVLSPDLTRKLEKRMNDIKLGEETRQNVIRDAVKALNQSMKRLKENEQVIGASLNSALFKARLEEKIISTCPACKSGKLMILRSRRTGKRFVGCSNYFKDKCTTSFPLPQTGRVKPANITCKRCSWPTVRVWKKGRTPWTLCLNLHCDSKKKQREKL
jgi:DNA topoisomerase-1